MTTAAAGPGVGEGKASGERRRDGRAALAAGLIVALACLSTIQSTVNSSPHVYTTDVGEIQNALPRWGTLHFTGYPVYSIVGSAFVTLLRGVGVAPALGASLYSLVWAVLGAAAVAALCVELGARRRPATLGAVLYGLSTSAWVNGSIAEVHSLTMLFTALCLWLAVRFDRGGARRDLLALALAFVHGVLHMRAVLFLAPALAILVAPRWREIVRAWRPLALIALVSPLVYLYMPLREWMGATWTFGQTRTWRGFWTMVLDTKADRIVRLPVDAGEWGQRARTFAALVNDDLWWPLVVVGLLGVWTLLDRRGSDHRPADGRAVRSSERRPEGTASRRVARLLPSDAGRHALGLTLAWVPYALLCLVIWEGKVSDALLAVKLPVALMAGVGLALGGTWVAQRLGDRAGHGASVLLALVAAAVAVRSFGVIRPIVRDRSLDALVANADRLSIRGASGVSPRPTLVALWGHSFWALSYAQAYQGRIDGVTIVDHNADVGAIARGGMLVTPADTVTVLDGAWWRERLGEVHPEMIAPGIVWLRRTPRPVDDPSIAGRDEGFAFSREFGPTTAEHPAFPVNADLAILADDVRCDPVDPSVLIVTIDWTAVRPPSRDESVAIHVLTGPDDRVLAQADRSTPVDGWRPTTGWAVGERVRDIIAIPGAGAGRDAVRVTAYHADGAGGFVNGAWRRLAVPDACRQAASDANAAGP